MPLLVSAKPFLPPRRAARGWASASTSTTVGWETRHTTCATAERTQDLCHRLSVCLSVCLSVLPDSDGSRVRSRLGLGQMVPAYATSIEGVGALVLSPDEKRVLLVWEYGI